MKTVKPLYAILMLFVLEIIPVSAWNITLNYIRTQIVLFDEVDNSINTILCYNELERYPQTHQLNSYPEVVLYENTYDDLGRLRSKGFHGSAALQTQYSYNIRSWITTILGGKFRQEPRKTLVTS